MLALCACSAADGNGDEAPNVPVPFAVTGDRLGVWNGVGYDPIFIKGVNLGVAVPGTLAGELAATREQYDRWLEQMGEIGINAVRVYTLHYPRFYEAVAHYNRAHPDAPIYVLHGVWLDEENPSHDFFDMTKAFDDGIREVVDCVHGHDEIAERKGRAFGVYRTDISRWVIGWVIGREIIPNEVETTNERHADHTRYDGEAIGLSSGSPLEAWFAERLDGLVRYERDTYGVERPVSVSSWPTLDPLRHPSEGPSSGEDSQSLDFETLDTEGAPAGYFASYHAYPYYPDFMTRDPDYQDARDELGDNTYVGYLNALKAHYATHPLLIAEFGIPTSWGNAHFGAGGMNHGGQNELQQGEQAARLLGDLLATHCAGGAFFAWIDEWWKRTWIVDPLAFPRDHYRLWHNVTSPEQNFGLIGFELDPPQFARWPAQPGTGRIERVSADADAEFFHVRVQLDAALPPGAELTVGFDTYGDDVGESRLPDGTETSRRNEFALVLHASDSAQLYVMRAYDLFGIWHGISRDDQLYHSVASDAGDWVPVRWRNNSPTAQDDLPNTDDVDEIGRFVVGTPSTADIRTGVIIDGSTIELRVPWTLLQFADPTTLTVIDDDRSTPQTESRVSQGIALSVQLGSDLVETPRYRWEPWTQAPATREREKASIEAFSQAAHALP